MAKLNSSLKYLIGIIIHQNKLLSLDLQHCCMATKQPNANVYLMHAISKAPVCNRTLLQVRLQVCYKE